MLTYSILLPSEYKRCQLSTNACFGISVCGFRWRAPVLKLEWILNCTTPYEAPRQSELTLLIDQISPRLLPWSLEFILNSELRIKYAETVHSWFKQIPFFELIQNLLFNLFASQIHRGESQSYQQIIRLHRRYPLVKEFPSSEWVYLSDQF